MLDIGISKKDRKLIADSLSCLLADKMILFLKQQSFYLNIKGENAYAMQLMFVEHSNELMKNIHKVAYRIRALDYFVPSSLKEYLHFTGLNDNKHPVNDTVDILKILILDNEFIVRRALDVYDIANTIGDPVTRDIMQSSMKFHSENVWKMRMHFD